MTREEAAQTINELIIVTDECDEGYYISSNQIEALEMGIKALNKQIGIKPHKIRWDERETRILCPQCNYRFYSLIDGEKITGNQTLYCPCCGQRIDWEEK